MSKSKLLFIVIVCIAFSSVVFAIDIPEPNKPNLNNDNIVNFLDYAIFAQNWLSTGVGLACDFDDNNLVDYNDLSVMAHYWLEGPPPKEIFEQFKTALAARDINSALTFMAEPSRDKYAHIFQIIEPNLPDFVAGMGDLIFDSAYEGISKYEMRHQSGSDVYLFPVIFMQDKNKKWQIYGF